MNMVAIKQRMNSTRSLTTMTAQESGRRHENPKDMCKWRGPMTKPVFSVYLQAEQENLGAFHFDEAAWTGFGGEQGPLATFQFADTGLALRFQG